MHALWFPLYSYSSKYVREVTFFLKKIILVEKADRVAEEWLVQEVYRLERVRVSPSFTRSGI